MLKAALQYFPPKITHPGRRKSNLELTCNRISHMIATDELPPQATEYLKSHKISQIYYNLPQRYQY